jgi:hypothetical protein
MDREKLFRFIDSWESDIGGLMVHIKDYGEWSPFYKSLLSCGLDFKYKSSNSNELELINYIIWIRKDNIWLTSPGKNSIVLSLSEFKREYNLYCLLLDS